MELSQAIRRRRMVRDFTAEPVSEALLTRILESALRAPSAGFAQGTELVVLDRRDQIEAFWRITDPRRRKKPRLDGTPPVIVLPFAGKTTYLRRYSELDKRGLGMDVEEGWPVAYWETDAAMAVMLILLSAVDEGLGAWYFGIFHGEAELLRWLKIPTGCRPIGAVALGYASPTERLRGSAPSRRRRSLEDVVHRGVWGKHAAGTQS